MTKLQLQLLAKRIFMKSYAVQTQNPTTQAISTHIYYGFDVIQALNKRPRGHGVVSVVRV